MITGPMGLGYHTVSPLDNHHEILDNSDTCYHIIKL